MMMIANIKKRLQRRDRKSDGRLNFRDRYEAVERRRTELLGRLQRMSDQARAHPGYRRALTLLNTRFRCAKIAQRAAILQAAEWLIDVLDMLTFIA